MKKIANSHVKMVAGVLAGAAYSLKMPVWVVRLLFMVAAFFTGLFPLMLVYLLLAIALPKLEISTDDFNKATRPATYKKVGDSEVRVDKYAGDVNYESMISRSKNIEKEKDE